MYIHRGSSNVPINWDTNSGKEQIRKIYPDGFFEKFCGSFIRISLRPPYFYPDRDQDQGIQGNSKSRI